MTSDFPHMDMVDDELDYQFVKSQSMAWIVAIENELKAGKTPGQISDWWLEKHENKRQEMRLRIFHAARHIARGMGD